MIKFSGEKRDFQKTLLKFVVMFWKNPNFAFFFFFIKVNFDVENKNFENKFFNPFDSQNIWSDENNDPDINFFNEKSETVKSPYYNMDKFNSSSQNLLKNSFSVLHINIRSMNKNFEKLREYLSHVKGNFSIIALTETLCSDDKGHKSSLWQLSNYTAIHQVRISGQKRGDIAL